MIDISIISADEALEKNFNAKEAFAKAAEEYAKVHSELLTLKNLKDISFQKIANKQEGKSAAEKERAALISEEWELFIQGLNDAIAENERVGAQKEIAKTGFEFWQTFLYDLQTRRRTGT